MEPALETTLENVNLVLTGIFFVEMVGKMIGMGLEHYLKEKANLLDMVIVILSMVDVLISIYIATVSENTSENLETVRSAAIVFRILRLTRVLKLAKSW